ncbi:unnamed protein product [Amoebophrya sp. A25]|nr:unnamed protein product [Amoebophrya sp. A25]|eukprot:GSA25T00000852001.1
MRFVVTITKGTTTMMARPSVDKLFMLGAFALCSLHARGDDGSANRRIHTAATNTQRQGEPRSTSTTSSQKSENNGRAHAQGGKSSSSSTTTAGSTGETKKNSRSSPKRVTTLATLESAMKQRPWYEVPWKRALYSGLEGDPDCGTWYNPDDTIEWLVEIAIAIPVLHMLWRKRPDSIADAFLKSGNRYKKIFSDPTKLDLLLAFIIFLPLPYLIQQRLQKQSLATMGHICHFALVSGLLAMTLPASCGGLTRRLLVHACLPFLGCFIPPLVKPDWRGWGPEYDVWIIPERFKVNMYTLSFYGEHIGLGFMNLWLLFGSRFAPLFEHMYHTCAAEFSWNTILGAYWILEIPYTAAARLLEYNIGYQNCPPAVIKPIAIRMLKSVVPNVHYEQYLGPVDWYDHAVVPRAGAYIDPFNRTHEVYSRRDIYADMDPNAVRLRFSYWHFWYNMCIVGWAFAPIFLAAFWFGGRIVWGPRQQSSRGGEASTSSSRPPSSSSRKNQQSSRKPSASSAAKARAPSSQRKKASKVRGASATSLAKKKKKAE